jgi:phage baseplate assembly protein W
MTTSAPDYGTDLSLGFETVELEYPDGTFRTSQHVDFTEDFAEVSGRTLLIQAICRRLITPRGALIDDIDYGSDVTRYCNDDIDPRDVGAIAAEIDAEIVKDERVKSSSTTATLDDEGMLITESQIVDLAGPFKLTLSVTSVTVELLGVRP